MQTYTYLHSNGTGEGRCIVRPFGTGKRRRFRLSAVVDTQVVAVVPVNRDDNEAKSNDDNNGNSNDDNGDGSNNDNDHIYAINDDNNNVASKDNNNKKTIMILIKYQQ